MNSIKVCEYSRSRSFHDDLILQDQASGERSQDHWSSGFTLERKSMLGMPRPSLGFGGFREKGYLFSGIWGEGSFIFRDLGRKHNFLGFYGAVG